MQSLEGRLSYSEYMLSNLRSIIIQMNSDHLYNIQKITNTIMDCYTFLHVWNP